MRNIKKIIKDLGIIKVKTYRSRQSDRYLRKVYFLGVKIYSKKTTGSNHRN